jgi:hypothetical protein
VPEVIVQVSMPVGVPEPGLAPDTVAVKRAGCPEGYASVGLSTKVNDSVVVDEAGELSVKVLAAWSMEATVVPVARAPPRSLTDEPTVTPCRVEQPVTDAEPLFNEQPFSVTGPWTAVEVNATAAVP